MTMRIRRDEKSNYQAIFINGKTIRQKINISKEILTPETPEIEDVAINTKCLAGCPYCYTSATGDGFNFDNILEKAYAVWGALEENKRPFQIAIGGAGESTLHPEWTQFVKTVRSMNIVPNYTTNGMHLSENVLRATELYCGGVALSYHKHIEKVFNRAIEKLSELETMLNVHLIIGNDSSLQDAKRIFDTYRNEVSYFVLLPYQAVGRGSKIETKETWKKMFEWISSLSVEEHGRFAFGALFYKYLLENGNNLNIDIYEPEMFSGYRIFDDSYMTLRKSSYDLREKQKGK